MTTAAKTWVAIISIIVLAVIGWAWYSNSSSMHAPSVPADTIDNSMSSRTMDNSTPAVSSANSSDSSDNSIDQDMTSVNAQMSGMVSDYEDADQTY